MNFEVYAGIYLYDTQSPLFYKYCLMKNCPYGIYEYVDDHNDYIVSKQIKPRHL